MQSVAFMHGRKCVCLLSREKTFLNLFRIRLETSGMSWDGYLLEKRAQSLPSLKLSKSATSLSLSGSCIDAFWSMLLSSRPMWRVRSIMTAKTKRSWLNRPNTSGDVWNCRETTGTISKRLSRNGEVDGDDCVISIQFIFLRVPTALRPVLLLRALHLAMSLRRRQQIADSPELTSSIAREVLWVLCVVAFLSWYWEWLIEMEFRLSEMIEKRESLKSRFRSEWHHWLTAMCDVSKLDLGASQIAPVGAMCGKTLEVTVNGTERRISWHRRRRERRGFLKRTRVWTERIWAR